MVSLLRTAKIFVLPSCIDENGDTEGSATAALEAMACGTISLVSRVGGNTGSIESGKGADYFDPADSDSLAKKIGFVLSLERDQEKEWRRLGRQYVIDHYDWNTILLSYLNKRSVCSPIKISCA